MTDHHAVDWWHAMALARILGDVSGNKHRVTKRNGEWVVTDPLPRDLLGEFATQWAAGLSEAS